MLLYQCHFYYYYYQFIGINGYFSSCCVARIHPNWINVIYPTLLSIQTLYQLNFVPNHVLDIQLRESLFLPRWFYHFGSMRRTSPAKLSIKWQSYSIRNLLYWESMRVFSFDNRYKHFRMIIFSVWLPDYLTWLSLINWHWLISIKKKKRKNQEIKNFYTQLRGLSFDFRFPWINAIWEKKSDQAFICGGFFFFIFIFSSVNCNSKSIITKGFCRMMTVKWPWGKKRKILFDEYYFFNLTSFLLVVYQWDKFQEYSEYTWNTEYRWLPSELFHSVRWTTVPLWSWLVTEVVV